MPKLKTFINQKFRPDVHGGRLDERHKPLFELDTNQSIANCVTLDINAICFGPRKDNVLINLEHAICKADKILIFYYEDIHQRWTYVNCNGESYFLYKKNELEQYIIRPKSIYVRGCYIAPNDKYWYLLGDLFNFFELYDGQIICHPRKQLPNESKLYQLNNSLKIASLASKSISIGKSYVVKGEYSYSLLDKSHSYIVKSLSGVRSIVVDDNSYKSWDVKAINNIPVLFQEKVDGCDLRVHIIDNKTFAKKSNEKKNVDYRYDDNFFKLAEVEKLHDDLMRFCIKVAKEEGNQLLGIDFIQTQYGHVVLEANPSPGWSAYHPYNGVDNEPFVSEILRVLRSN